jgi:hypothetical protein
MYLAAVQQRLAWIVHGVEASGDEAPEQVFRTTARQMKRAGSAERGMRRLLPELQRAEKFSVA